MIIKSNIKSNLSKNGAQHGTTCGKKKQTYSIDLYPE